MGGGRAAGKPSDQTQNLSVACLLGVLWLREGSPGHSPWQWRDRRVLGDPSSAFCAWTCMWVLGFGHLAKICARTCGPYGRCSAVGAGRCAGEPCCPQPCQLRTRTPGAPRSPSTGGLSDGSQGPPRTWCLLSVTPKGASSPGRFPPPCRSLPPPAPRRGVFASQTDSSKISYQKIPLSVQELRVWGQRNSEQPGLLLRGYTCPSQKRHAGAAPRPWGAAGLSPEKSRHLARTPWPRAWPSKQEHTGGSRILGPEDQEGCDPASPTTLGTLAGPPQPSETSGTWSGAVGARMGTHRGCPAPLMSEKQGKSSWPEVAEFCYPARAD